MSQPADDTTSHDDTPINSLSAPADKTILQARASHLSQLSKPLIADRVELRAVLQLLFSGTVSKYEVWTALRDLYFTHDFEPHGATSERSEQAREDTTMIWNNLQVLASGQIISMPPRPEPTSSEYEGWVESERERGQIWIRELLGYVGQLDNHGPEGIYAQVVATHLPASVRRSVEKDYARTLLGSPYSLGVALESLPTSRHYFGDENGFALLATLAQTVRRVFDECKKAWPPISGQQTENLERLALHWMILKGFVYSMVTTEDRMLANGLYNKPELAKLVIEALRHGHAELTRSHPNGSRWLHAPGIGDSAVNTPTAELIRLLEERIEAGRQFRRTIEASRGDQTIL